MPIFFIYSYLKGDQICLVFEDNGMGMNMDKIRGKIFGFYQKFHHHPDRKGISLYLVHSQLSTLGGSFEVKSKENEGAKFTINFKSIHS